jgi:hypothetical protein
MLELLYQVLLWYSLAAGLLLTLGGLVGLKPGRFVLALSAGSLAGLLVQLLVSIVLVFSGERAVVSTLEFFGYLIVAFLIPVAGAIWALAEPTKWATVILGAALLTIAVMLVRMMQIWTGVNPVTMVGV